MDTEHPTALTPASNAAWLPVVIFLIHAGIGYGLYGGVAEYHWKLNEFVVIELPYIAAGLAYYACFKYSPWFRRHGAVRLIASFLCPFFSLSAYMIVVLNQWGS